MKNTSKFAGKNLENSRIMSVEKSGNPADET